METKTKKSGKKDQQKSQKKVSHELHVFFNGPFSDGGDKVEGIERPYWTIYVSIDLDAEPKYAYRVNNFDKAHSLAEKISQDQGIDIISSALSAN